MLKNREVVISTAADFRSGLPSRQISLHVLDLTSSYHGGRSIQSDTLPPKLDPTA
jgi:hypothetical protein